MTLIKAPIDVNNKVHQFRVIKITTFYSTAGIFIHFNHLSKQTNYETLLSVTSPSKEKNFRCFQYFLSEEVKLHIQRGFIRIISKSLFCRS